ncbi:MAG: glutamine synthetase [Myxococcales bacterium]|nr:glutamine synthetase [Myxococcales bacterium]
MQLPDWFSKTPPHGTAPIDTVLVAFPDVYGRLMGKRLTYDHFVDVVLDGGTHACNYLLTVDIEMHPQLGFSLASWDKGYGDFHMVVDLDTLRPTPWAPGSALVLCDLYHEDHTPLAQAPRTVLKRQLERLAAQNLKANMASELEFFMFEEDYREAQMSSHRDLMPSSDYLIDYHLLSTERDEDVMRRLREEMGQAGVVIEGSKGEWGKGQHELNLLYAEALEMADRHVVFKHGTKVIAQQQGRSITFMAKWRTEDAGSSCHIHSSLWDTDADTAAFVTGDQPSELFSKFLGGLLAHGRELSYCFAPTVNSYKRYQSESWAPTAMAWAHDNRTTGFRVVGSGSSLRIENRMPGADVNPYLAYAATIAAGLRGVEGGLDCGPAYKGNAYVDKSLERLPDSLADAARLLDGSELAHEAFGAEVVEFYVHTAKLESEAARRQVTDWERARYFERV